MRPSATSTDSTSVIKRQHRQRQHRQRQYMECRVLQKMPAPTQAHRYRRTGTGSTGAGSTGAGSTSTGSTSASANKTKRLQTFVSRHSLILLTRWWRLLSSGHPSQTLLAGASPLRLRQPPLLSTHAATQAIFVTHMTDTTVKYKEKYGVC